MAVATSQRTRETSLLPAAGSIRTFLLIESATFLSAAMLHMGFFLPSYAHAAAATAESVIASVLLGGLILTWIRPHMTRGVGLGAQGFALAGTFVGLLTIAVGIGPRTALDLGIHATMVVELVAGLIVSARIRRRPAGVPA